ncbi:hypothetical protein LWI29_032089 [Acer saccharum]|uniref:Uncharacterized protein n=1 Tax=Acer saccharum TaxID=4024 RepID=A0AA39RFF2_ACESA|nr:hypothetical protein LWI29_032089 [Acer saccharum]
MARLIRSAHRTLVSSAFYRSQFHGVPSHNGSPLIQSGVATSSSLIHFRPYTAKSTDEDDILTILDSKISRLHSPEELVPVETFDSFKVEYEPKKNVVVLNKRFGNREHIRIEFDNHNMTVDVSKEDGGSDALRFTRRWFQWGDSLDDQPLQFELANELSRDKLASSHNRHDIHEYDFIQLPSHQVWDLENHFSKVRDRSGSLIVKLCLESRT